jgi:hypothetical protein
MAFLPNDSAIAQGVCGAGGAHQQLLQINQCRQIDLRGTHGHPGAHRRIEHPISHGDDDTGRPLNLQEPPRRSLLHSPDADHAAEIRMPAVTNFQFLGDMGRMNGCWLSEENRGYSAARTAVASAPPSCTR